MRKTNFSITMVAAIVLLTGCKKSSDPSPAAGFVIGGTYRTAPIKVPFHNTSNYAGTYNWDFGDGGTSTAKDPEHIYTVGGTYTVKLTANGVGSDVATNPITIKPANTQAKYTYIKVFNLPVNNGSSPWDTDGSGPDVFYKIKDAGGTVIFDASADKKNDVITYPLQWNFGSTIFLQPVSGIYTIEFWDYDGASSELIASIPFNPQLILLIDPSDPYAPTATLTVGSTNLEIGITWL